METALEVKNSSDNGHSDSESIYFFDVSKGKLILGKFALENYLSDNEIDSEIYELGELIHNSEIKFNTENIKPEKNWSTENRQSYIEYGRWLISISDNKITHDDIGTRPTQKKIITEAMIKRVNKLGLGPSRDQIMHPNRFGSLGQFYTELGDPRTARRYIFRKWSEKDALNYLQEISDAIGHFPTWNELEDLATSDINRPRVKALTSILGYSIVEAADKLKIPHYRHWSIKTNMDFILWGVQFMINNNGKVPTESDIVDSRNQDGPDYAPAPAVPTIVKRFKKISNYQKLLQVAYEQQLSTNNRANGKQLDEDTLKTTSTISNGNRYNESDIFHSSVSVGVDFMHANDGQFPSADDLINLQKAGYLDVGPDKIFNVFDDIDDYWSFISNSYREDLENSDQYKADILAEIESLNGDLPPDLFRKVIKTERYKRETNAKKKRSIASGVVTNDIVSDNEKIIRYSRYKLINYLIPNGELSLDRKLSIAIGFNLNTSKFSLTSISSEICKSNLGITMADVELAASELEIFDYIYPHIKNKYLKDLRKEELAKAQ